MKIFSNIENIEGRYHVQITTHGFTGNEEELLLQFGDPVIDVGSNFAGSATRPNQTNTVVTINPVSGGTGATAVPVISPTGALLSISLVTGGTGYTNGATAVITGDGTGATATVTVAGGIVTGFVITGAGSGYNVVPYPVTFVLPPALRRMRADSPFVQVFDLDDYPDADVRAKVWSDTIVSRLTTAKATLINMSSPFMGESMVTV